MSSDGRIRVIAPGPGRCRICAAKHRPGTPHEVKSLYYQVRFYLEHKRFPTAEDAGGEKTDCHGPGGASQ